MSKINPPPPPYGSAPPPYGTTSNVVVTQPGYIALPLVFREHPLRCKCTACGADIVTSTHYETGTLAWIICLLMAVMGLWLGCCLIPFCLDGCKDVIHSCPNCRNVIGKYNRM